MFGPLVTVCGWLAPLLGVCSEAEHAGGGVSELRIMISRKEREGKADRLFTDLPSVVCFFQIGPTS